MRWLMALTATVCLAAFISGCGSAPACAPATTDPIHLVLTFDDGPFAADVADKLAVTPDALLAPLRIILEVLARRRARGVFYIAGPGSDQAANQLAGTFADGLEAIHQSGHVLGYHAFAHEVGIWANLPLPPPIIELVMNDDLDRLQSLIDDSLRPRAAFGADLLSPLFRQPFGGIGLLSFEGADVAAQRGWVYHGFRIDSGDWLANAQTDPALRRQLAGDSDEALTAFVKSCLIAGASANQGCGSLDILFHVNGFTAAHLDEWIDTLSASFSRAAQPVSGASPASPIFDVPDSYLRDSDSFVDTTIGVSAIGF